MRCDVILPHTHSLKGRHLLVRTWKCHLAKIKTQDVIAIQGGCVCESVNFYGYVGTRCTRVSYATGFISSPSI